MRLKTYFASGVDAAMAMARGELGPEAMLVHSKRTSAENASLGAFEVVFAVTAAENASVQTTTPASAADAAGSTLGLPNGIPSEDLSSLREAVDLTLRLVRRSEALLTAQCKDGEMADLASALEYAGFSPQFRVRLLQDMRGVAQENLRASSISWLLRQLKTQHSLGKSGPARKIAALVGPPGAGKTTTLVKLAARFGVTGRRPAQILSLDSEKIGGTESLRAYANVLGIGMQVLDSTHALLQALNEHSNKELILIDTPGLTARPAAAETEMSGFLSSQSDIDVILVLAATTSTAVLKQYAESYSTWSPSKLIFTRLDETGGALGGMLETAIEAALPLSYCGTGQGTPEDLEAADAAVYSDRALPEWLENPALREKSRRAAA